MSVANLFTHCMACSGLMGNGIYADKDSLVACDAECATALSVEFPDDTVINYEDES